MLALDQIWIHPVKSLAGYRVDAAEARERGLRHDRAWVAVDASGEALTQRTVPKMALVRAAADATGVTLSAEGVDPLRATADSSRRCRAVVWEDAVDGADGGDAAAEWLTAVLGVPCRLVHMDGHAERQTYPDGGAGRPVRFADELPLVLMSAATLADLDARRPGFADVRRFRPNLVISGCDPYAEDTWTRLAIGGVEIEVVKPASRCLVICVDPNTGAPDPRSEPLRTLAGYRRGTLGDYPDKPERIYLGVRAAVARAGELRVGAKVELLG